MNYSFDDFEIDENRFRLYENGQAVAIQPRPLQLLIHLLRNRHRLVHRQEVLEALWPGLKPSQASLDRAVRSARRALGDRGHEPRYIATVRNVGFRFLPDVRTPGAESGDPTPLSAARTIELLLEAAELSKETGRLERARQHALEAAGFARRTEDAEGLIRAAVLLGSTTNGSQHADPEVREVARAALALWNGERDARHDRLNELASAA